jgi:hypothetical protein
MCLGLFRRTYWFDSEKHGRFLYELHKTAWKLHEEMYLENRYIILLQSLIQFNGIFIRW